MKKLFCAIFLAILSAIVSAQQNVHGSRACEASSHERLIAQLNPIPTFRIAEDKSAVARVNSEDLSAIAQKLFYEQKQDFNCILTEQEMRTAAEEYIKANPIAFDSEKDPTRHERLLVKAIQKLNKKRTNADKVYKELELGKNGIHKRKWERYVKSDMAQSQLLASKDRITKNQEELDVVLIQMHIIRKEKFEAGLLAARILTDYNARHSKSAVNEKNWSDWGDKASKKKEAAFRKWWSEKLAKRYPDKAEREAICQILTKDTLSAFAHLLGNGYDWRPVFKDKLAN